MTLIKPNCGICGKEITGDDSGFAIFQANKPNAIRNTCPECTNFIDQVIDALKLAAKFKKGIFDYEVAMADAIRKKFGNPSEKFELGGINFKQDDQSPYITANEKVIDMNEVRKYIPNLNPPSFKLDTTRPIEEEDL